MAQIAFVFAGQGAQYSGMGQQLWQDWAEAKEVFALADGLRPGTSAQCFTSDKEELSLTINTQPTLFAVDLACAAVAAANGIKPAAVAGFSLGELPALAFSGCLSYEEAFLLTCKRAQYMQEAAQEHEGGMMAVLRLSNQQVEELCTDIDQVYAVNYNCPGQVVVAGLKTQLPLLAEKVKAAGGRAMPLAVSGAFHCPLMQSAADKLAQDLAQITFAPPQMPIYSNVTANVYGNGQDLVARQVISPVLWQKTIENMLTAGCDTFVEVGAGKTLCGLIKKIVPEHIRVLNIEDRASLGTTLAALESV